MKSIDEAVLSDYRAAGKAALAVLSGDGPEQPGADPEEEVPADARYALARLQQELARGPASGEDFKLPKDLLLTTTNGRLPDPRKLAGRIVINKTQAGQLRLKKQLVRLEKEGGLNPVPPWEVKQGGPFSAAFGKVRVAMTKEITTQLETEAMLLFIGNSRTGHIDEAGRKRHVVTMKKHGEIVTQLHRRLTLWRELTAFGLSAMQSGENEDWSYKSIVQDLRTP